MTDHGKWSSPTLGVRLMDTKGPFEKFMKRTNPDMGFGPKDRAYRAKYLKDHLLTPKDASTSIHDLRTNPDWQKAR